MKLFIFGLGCGVIISLSVLDYRLSILGKAIRHNDCITNFNIGYLSGRANLEINKTTLEVCKVYKD